MPLFLGTAPKVTAKSTSRKSIILDGLTPVVVSYANHNKLGVTIYNPSPDVPLWLDFSDENATVGIESFYRAAEIPPGGYYEVPFDYTGTIYAAMGLDSPDGALVMVREFFPRAPTFPQ